MQSDYIRTLCSPTFFIRTLCSPFYLWGHYAVRFLGHCVVQLPLDGTQSPMMLCSPSMTPCSRTWVSLLPSYFGTMISELLEQWRPFIFHRRYSYSPCGKLSPTSPFPSIVLLSAPPCNRRSNCLIIFLFRVKSPR